MTAEELVSSVEIAYYSDVQGWAKPAEACKSCLDWEAAAEAPNNNGTPIYPNNPCATDTYVERLVEGTPRCAYPGTWAPVKRTIIITVDTTRATDDDPWASFTENDLWATIANDYTWTSAIANDNSGCAIADHDL